jgi:hypothetical protein
MQNNLVLIAALLVFNLPILFIGVRLPFAKKLSDALCEKDPTGVASGALSYSRVTGLFGAVIVTCFFWAIGDVILWKAMVSPAEVKEITANLGPFFLVGSALFLPYAFNQLKTVFQ